MPDARTRLDGLLDLAARPEAREALVRELSALLLDWPADYPLAMRTPFERLLEQAAREVCGDTRADLATRFAAVPVAPVALLNELFFDAPDAVKPEILRRNALAFEPAGDTHVVNALEGTLVASARARCRASLAEDFARALGVGRSLAERILCEPSGEALAAACKGAGLKRTTFSALALLLAPGGSELDTRLGAYDAVPEEGAHSLVRYWRDRAEPAEDDSKAA